MIHSHCTCSSTKYLFIYIESDSSLDKCNFIYSGTITWNNIPSLPKFIFYECKNIFGCKGCNCNLK